MIYPVCNTEISRHTGTHTLADKDTHTHTSLVTTKTPRMVHTVAKDTHRASGHKQTYTHTHKQATHAKKDTHAQASPTVTAQKLTQTHNIPTHPDTSDLAQGDSVHAYRVGIREGDPPTHSQQILLTRFKWGLSGALLCPKSEGIGEVGAVPMVLSFCLSTTSQEDFPLPPLTWQSPHNASGIWVGGGCRPHRAGATLGRGLRGAEGWGSKGDGGDWSHAQPRDG